MVSIQKQQLADQVIQQLQARIASGELAVGDKLPSEFTLMEQLGVGRSTVREAVRVLAHSGVLEVRQGDGTYVRATPSAAESLAQRLRRARAGEVHEVRRALELEIVRLAALRRDMHDVEQMQRWLHERQAATARNDPTAVLDADIALHGAIAAATKNEVLADLYRAFTVALRAALDAIVAVSGLEPVVADAHDQLVAAIVARDAEASVRVTTALLEHNTALLAEHLD